MTGTPSLMSRAEVDRVIGELGAVHERISTLMYALDTEPELAVLRTAQPTGDTALLAAEVLARVGVLWSQFTALTEALDQAREVRARRSRPGDTELRELTRLLRLPLVRLDADGMVLDESTVGPPARRMGLAELARRIETEASALTGTLTELGAARDRLVTWFSQLTATVQRLRSDVAVLGGDPLLAADLDDLVRRVDQAYGRMLGDPLAASGNGPAATGIRELTAEVDAFTGRLAELTELRNRYPERAARLGAELDELAALATRTGQVHAVALAKIANPALPDLADVAPALRAQLAQLEQLYRGGRWPRLGMELSAIEQAAAVARHRMAELHEAADGLLRRRGELRGRLDAYRAKAGRLGLIEHLELSERYRLARDLLYTSPCDLSAATRAVVAYQRHLNDLAERSTPGRREPYL